MNFIMILQILPFIILLQGVLEHYIIHQNFQPLALIMMLSHVTFITVYIVVMAYPVVNMPTVLHLSPKCTLVYCLDYVQVHLQQLAS